MQANIDVSKETIIKQVLQQMTQNLDFKDSEMDQLYQLSV